MGQLLWVYDAQNLAEEGHAAVGTLSDEVWVDDSGVLGFGT